MKTIEFKLDLNRQQQESVDSWLEIQRQVWNRGLALLKEFEAFARYNKHDKVYAPCCPINWEYRWIKEGDKFIAVPFSKIGFKPKYGEYRQFCPIPQSYREPRLKGEGEYAITPLFAYKLPENQWLANSGCPYKLTQATLRELATSWKEYRKGKRKSPRFKGEGDFKALSNTQSGNAVAKGGDRLKLPKLGAVRVKGLDKRWGGLEVKTYHIVKEPSGYYLLMVGNVSEKMPKPSDKAVGIDPGVAAAVTLDSGRQFKPANPLKAYLKRLKRLQRKLSRQVKLSNGWKKTQVLIARLHEKIRRTRKAFNHKISTKICREYGAIAFEGTQLQNMVRRPKAKLKEGNKGWERNNAAAKAGLNRALLDVAIGQLRTFTEQKCKAWDREFVKSQAHNSSLTCNACGVVDKANRRSQSKFLCVACGNVDHADSNAAKNHLSRGLTEFKGIYRSWDRESTQVENLKDSIKPEATHVALSPGHGEQDADTTLAGTLTSSVSYRSWERKVTRVESPMKTMKPEADSSAPSPEHGDQSKSSLLQSKSSKCCKSRSKRFENLLTG